MKTPQNKHLRTSITFDSSNMTFLHDKRAVSEVLGAILVFGILIAALGLYQAFVVPQANEQAEFNHNLDIQKDILDLRTTIRSVETSGASQSVSMQLAADYSSRIIAINPPTPYGELRTSGLSNSEQVVIRNARAINPDAEDYWNGSEFSFDSGHIVFEPNYNLYQNAPTTYIDHSVVYNIFDNDRIVRKTDQRIIQGNLITIGTLVGDRSFSDREANIEITPASASSNKIAITNGTERIEIDIPTRLEQEDWEVLLSDQPHVETIDVDSDENIVTITLEPGVYELNMAKLGLGPGVEEEDPHYIVRKSGDGQAVQRSQQVSVTAEVRDQFNNPVSGANVEFSTEDGGEFVASGDSEVSISTDETGQARVKFITPNENGTVTITAKIGEEEREYVEFDIDVGEFDADIGDVGLLNPGDKMVLIGQDHDGNVVDLKFDVKQDLNITEARFNLFFIAVGQGDAPGSIIDIEGRTVEMERGGDFDYIVPGLELVEGEERVISMEFDEFPGGAQRALLAVTFRFEGEAASAQYLIGLEPDGGGGPNGQPD